MNRIAARFTEFADNGFGSAYSPRRWLTGSCHRARRIADVNLAAEPGNDSGPLFQARAVPDQFAAFVVVCIRQQDIAGNGNENRDHRRKRRDRRRPASRIRPGDG